MPPVTLKQRRSVFTNSRFTVFSDHIAAESLEVRDFLVVKPHSSRADLLTGVAVVAVRQGAILLLKHYRHPVSEFVWELPRGFIDPDETPGEAAARELGEETGLLCSADSLVSLGTFLPDPGVLEARVALFAALNCADGSRLADEIGIYDRLWHSEEAIYAMLRDGSIVEGATCVALHRYFERTRWETRA